MVQFIVLPLTQKTNGKYLIIDIRLSDCGTKVFWAYHGGGIAYLCDPLNIQSLQRKETINLSMAKLCEDMEWELITGCE